MIVLIFHIRKGRTQSVEEWLRILDLSVLGRITLVCGGNSFIQFSGQYGNCFVYIHVMLAHFSLMWSFHSVTKTWRRIHLQTYVQTPANTAVYRWLCCEAARGPGLGFNYPSPAHTHTHTHTVFNGCSEGRQGEGKCSKREGTYTGGNLLHTGGKKWKDATNKRELLCEGVTWNIQAWHVCRGLASHPGGLNWQK